jgi:hypothetical protein
MSRLESVGARRWVRLPIGHFAALARNTKETGGNRGKGYKGSFSFIETVCQEIGGLYSVTVRIDELSGSLDGD